MRKMSVQNNGLRLFFTFYGGKRRVAKHYPCPEYNTIIEPFAGSAGYSLQYFDNEVILVEKDPLIAATWRYLLTVPPAVIRALPDLLPGQTVNDLKVCEEAKLLIGWWLNKGGEQSRKSPSSWMRQGAWANSFWGENIRARIASQLGYIRHWKIIEGDYTKVPNIKATWFIDPPYQKAGKCYRFGSKKINYDDLAHWCKNRKGQVIVCENVGATWLPFLPWRKIQSNHLKKISNEAIWTNE